MNPVIIAAIISAIGQLANRGGGGGGTTPAPQQPQMPFPDPYMRGRQSLAELMGMDSFAHGGVSRGGPAMVGELGPEILDLAPGDEVVPYRQPPFPDVRPGAFPVPRSWRTLSESGGG